MREVLDSPKWTFGQGRLSDPHPHPEPCGLLRIEFVFDQARVFFGRTLKLEGREKKTEPQKKSQAIFFKTQVFLQLLIFEGQVFSLTLKLEGPTKMN